MFNKCLAILALSLATVAVHAQSVDPEHDQHGTMSSSGAPAAALCHASTVGQIYNDTTAGATYVCKADLTWEAGPSGQINAATDVTGVLAVSHGGTGGATAAVALTALGAAPLASPSLTGTPLAPTAAASTNNTQIATTAYVRTAMTSTYFKGTITTVSGTLSYPVTMTGLSAATGVCVWSADDAASQAALTNFTGKTVAANSFTMTFSAVTAVLHYSVHCEN